MTSHAFEVAELAIGMVGMTAEKFIVLTSLTSSARLRGTSVPLELWPLGTVMAARDFVWCSSM